MDTGRIDDLFMSRDNNGKFTIKVYLLVKDQVWYINLGGVNAVKLGKLVSQLLTVAGKSDWERIAGRSMVRVRFGRIGSALDIIAIGHIEKRVWVKATLPK
jgi:hypothetical protein